LFIKRSLPSGVPLTMTCKAKAEPDHAVASMRASKPRFRLASVTWVSSTSESADAIVAVSRKARVAGAAANDAPARATNAAARLQERQLLNVALP
jgi:hypothetical protein